jgi:LptA/(LptD N-terminal domain) LPS transport protein
MWTPKRIVLLVLGFFVFFSAYLLYASCLGGIDGLPPLPDMDLPNPGGPDALGPVAPRGLKLEDKLRQAFGPDCPEMKWPLILEMNAKNMVVAARDFKIGDDGVLDLDHISVALFDKDQGDGREVEINTIRAKKAYLEFDKKLGKSEKDFGSRRIVAAQLIDDIEIVNNHRTTQREDDLHLNIKKGPLYYDESKHLIWTTDEVHIEDDQNQPPTDIRGQGMDVHLTAAEPQTAPRPGTPAPRGKAKSESLSGVESIVLHSDVVMHLPSTGGFLSHAPEANAKAAGPAAPPADVSIFTPGSFRYEFHKEGDIARFDVPEADPARPEKAGPVKVIRHSATPEGKDIFDQLICQHLEMKLTRKEAGAGHNDKAGDHGLQIETAHAVALGGDEVEVKSDAEKLLAHGHDFMYNARTRLTILKGDPNKPDSGMSADSDGSLILAREMQIQDQQGPAGKSWRQITAKGPGRLDFQEKKSEPVKKPEPGKKPQPAKKPTHASWEDKLTSTKDGPLDLIILTGAAKFIDEENDQTLQGETLKVWLTSSEGAPAAAQAAPRDVRRPSHVEATGNVSTQSKEMTIPHAGQLVIWFRDVPAGAMLPTMGPAAQLQANAAPAKAAASGVAVAPAPKAPAPAVASAAPAAPVNAAPEPVRPIDLTARSVYVWVARSEDKTSLEKLDAEIDVEVHQAAAKPDEKPLYVKGESLELTYHPEGDFMVVRGDLAQIQMETIYILGPEVTIDQATNKAWVVGAGAMQLESATNFQGEKLAKPVPMTIHWNDNMFFDGGWAEFSKGVQAEQENAHLACQTLQVSFDHPVSLKEGNHGGPPPRVKNLVCYKDVRIDDRTLEDGRVVSAKRLNGPSLSMNALEPEEADVKAQTGSPGNEIRMPGPGDVRLFQIGGADPLAAPPEPGAKVIAAKPAPGAAKKSDDVMKLTYISYGGVTGGSMYANSKTKTAIFLENVRVLNMPCDNPNIEIDLDNMLELPEGALYLKSDRVEVYNRGDKKKSQQEMTAKGHVLVNTKEFYARSDVMRYNEAKDQIIFEGGDGGNATLYKIKQRGAPSQKIEGKKITYIRSTGRFQIDGGDWLSGEN